ncbi:penicillin-binding protein 1C, transpeptidase and transglycosylase [Leptospira ryugenii]|uniref:peptidoglycan glycosyltransferase n=1 Tax=Leptospira ryugenii TaxID=1917863 RepID=A0A2P2E035_9LEPT|nr:penicillin-binding protein 1C [Leptospira ryugenii]GBF50245.1 penicillin-binding protein 1C, transpeptidase and transglycosylase [Leptospira ryugenii]
MFTATFALTASPSYEEVKKNYRPSDLIFLDREGIPIQSKRIHFEYRAEDWVEYENIPTNLIEMVVWSEDKKFFEHSGVDTLSFLSSLWNAVKGEKIRGASTITMQLVAILNPELAPKQFKRNFAQKLKQIQAATELENQWNKEQIISAYLNLIYFRGELKGIGAASKGLFKKKVENLSDFEVVLLASLIRAPEANVERVAERSCLLAKEKLKEESCEPIKQFVKETLFANLQYKSSPNQAKLFIDRMLSQGDISRQTSLSLSIQKQVLSILKSHVLELKEQMVNDGAVLVMHNQTSQIVVYVANIGEVSSVPFVDLIQAKRQAGSTLKPFVYAQGFEEKKIQPDTILLDSPIDIPVFQGTYRPLNYDKSFKGKVSVRQSLASSLNIPAVRVLSYLDMGRFIETLSNVGFRNLAYPEYYGPSLALGSADISLWELTNAYRVFANKGMFSNPIYNAVENQTEYKRVFSKETSGQITDILSDREARSTSFGLENFLSTRYPSAVKTGTSQDMRDNWCVGYTSEYTVGVWVGNTEGKPMRNVTGISGAGPVWREVMDILHANISPNEWKREVDNAPKEDPPPKLAAPSLVLVPKIESPTRGAIYAFDPDIPKSQQRILFRMNRYSSDWFWVLNGKKLEVAKDSFLWAVERGDFILEVLDQNGRIIDKVTFEVR